MSKLIAALLKDESGATAIEYGLIAALISVALITGAGALGTSLNSQFNATPVPDRPDILRPRSPAPAGLLRF
jgi:pilus assembly protein Flp/PilA